MNVVGVNDVRRTEIRTPEPLVSDPSALEVEISIEKLKTNKSPDIDQIPTELIEGGVEKFALRSMNLLILFGKRRHCLTSGRSLSLYLIIRRDIKQIVVIIGA